MEMNSRLKTISELSELSCSDAILSLEDTQTLTTAESLEKEQTETLSQWQNLVDRMIRLYDRTFGDGAFGIKLAGATRGSRHVRFPGSRGWWVHVPQKDIPGVMAGGATYTRETYHAVPFGTYLRGDPRSIIRF